MLKVLKCIGVCGYLLVGSLVWISSTGWAETLPGDHEEYTTAEGGQKDSTKKATGDGVTPKTAALKRMEDELKKTSDTTLRQFTSQLAQFQKVDADILGGIVDKLPGLNEELTKGLKESFKESFAKLGDTADADFHRMVLGLLGQRFDDGKKRNADDQQKVREAMDKALAEQTDKAQKAKLEQKSATDKFLEDVNKRFDDALKAADASRGSKKNGLGDIPPNLGSGDTGSGQTPSDSGSGSGSESGSGGGRSAGKSSGNEPKSSQADDKSTKAKPEPLAPLKLGDSKSSLSEAKAATKEEDPFSFDKSKKESKAPPATIKTGAGDSQSAGKDKPSDVIDPSQTFAQPGLSGNSSAAAAITPYAADLSESGNGGSGAGIQINSASPSPLSGGEGDVFSRLGTPIQSFAGERSRFVYQRTGEKDWTAGGGSVEGGDSPSSGGNDANVYTGSKFAGPTLAAFGLSSSTQEKGSTAEEFGVFSANPLKKLCRSSTGISVGVCATRAVKAPARRLGSLYEKARAGGLLRVD